jgi:glycerophosphoryl diester phosphodiesterase
MDRKDGFVTLVIGHKGAPTTERENSVAAFRRARALGVDGVELDVRRAAGGRLAVWHDPTLPDGRALLDTPWKELDSEVADLDTVLDACAGLQLVNVEVKNWPFDQDFDDTLGVAEAVAAALAERPAAERARMVVSCFHRPTVDRLRVVLDDLAAEVATAWLLWNVDDPDGVVAVAVENRHAALHPHFTAVTPELLDAAHAAGLTVNCWTCNDLDRIRQLAAMGTDGIITDLPEAARAALDAVDTVDDR